MSWTINVVKNTIKMSKECFEELEPILEEEGYLLGYDEKTMEIDPDWDAMEWIDFVTNMDKKVLPIMKKHKVNGELCFFDGEGDTKGQGWGHRFRDGEHIPLVQQVSWIES